MSMNIKMQKNSIHELIADISVDIYLDTANLDIIKELAKENYIKGFTSNPSLMAKYGITSYENFIKEFLNISQNKPVSFEVCADELNLMHEQALRISKFSDNIYVKIPYYNTKGLDTLELINKLTKEKIKINVTALMSFDQIKSIVDTKEDNTESILSIFAGRIADSGRDPKDTIKESVNYIKSSKKNFKILWASVREIYNLYEADKCGSNIITVAPELIPKIKLRNKGLKEYSIETSKMFYQDALKNKLEI